MQAKILDLTSIVILWEVMKMLQLNLELYLVYDEVVSEMTSFVKVFYSLLLKDVKETDNYIL